MADGQASQRVSTVSQMAPEELAMLEELEEWVISECNEFLVSHSQSVQNMFEEWGDDGHCSLQRLAEMRKTSKAQGKLRQALKEHQRMKEECFKGIQPHNPKGAFTAPYMRNALALKCAGTYIPKKWRSKMSGEVMKNICGFLDPLESILFNRTVLKKSAIKLRREVVLEPVCRSILNWCFREMSELSNAMKDERYCYFNVLKTPSGKVNLDLHFIPSAFPPLTGANAKTRTNSNQANGDLSPRSRTASLKLPDSIVPTPGKDSMMRTSSQGHNLRQSMQPSPALTRASVSQSGESEIEPEASNIIEAESWSRFIQVSFGLDYWKPEDVDAMEKHIPKWRLSQFIKPVLSVLQEWGYAKLFAADAQMGNRLIINFEALDEVLAQQASEPK